MAAGNAQHKTIPDIYSLCRYCEEMLACSDGDQATHKLGRQLLGLHFNEDLGLCKRVPPEERTDLTEDCKAVVGILSCMEDAGKQTTLLQ
eukprot:CAMPEP_0206281898 /NCGR_PEP_ID=MMETSP0047_2-20121206/39388_1 /ASSEMBLY_ACC=CAM_ASM_000192 /TAXON_ID=195065 /ORGANISM="Chroomonas mesostigmatica_cf, Strain CCMP1168" /LENGTH=89 /DNA_ID=CAMNT_0053712119 /DNA_START=111 /DNA_END=377 /DNA_ORIENTATION=+